MTRPTMKEALYVVAHDVSGVTLYLHGDNEWTDDLTLADRWPGLAADDLCRQLRARGINIDLVRVDQVAS